MGEGIDRKLKELEGQTPLGMELQPIAMQSEAVVKSINGFMINLLEAVAIVVVVLLFAMGLRSGLIIGGILFLTISGTFLFMDLNGIILERISLGALIIALGMLVDNAIVVIDGMQVRIEQGEDRIKAAAAVVGQTAVPLLGATVVAILAFASIGTSEDSTGEYCRSLYEVILISLMLSWLTAVTATPLFGKWFLKGKPAGKSGEKPKDPYAGKVYQLYKRGLIGAIRNRWITVGVIAGIFFLSLYAFGFVKQMFFPSSASAQFFVEFYLPEGIHIRDTEAEMAKAEEHLLGLDGVTSVSTTIGGAEPRFLLTYVPTVASTGSAVIFISVEDWTIIDGLMPKVQADLERLLPDAVVNVRKFLLGPGEGGKIQLRIFGKDRTVLRQLAAKAKQIMFDDADAKAIRDEWKEKVKVVRPQVAEAQARQLGISRPQVGDAFMSAFAGKQTGVYREGEELLAIIARAP
ncbi:MAG: efflux RND transporter permease subunit, partial [Bacteroidetes bacterium]|nr:efflux RND transporter permease subunit [Bacteroidota bacterium]